MTVPILSVLGSVFILCVCFYRLHTLSSKDKFYVRITWVLLAGASLLMPWTALVVGTPAIVSPHVQVVDSSESRILMRVSATSIRDCKVVSSNVQAKKDGTTIQLPSRYYGFPKGTGGSEEETGILYVENNGFLAQDISITLDHFCPFGVEVRTEVQEAKEIFSRKGK